MFPAIRQAFRDIRQGFGGEPVSLDLKSIVGTGSEKTERIRMGVGGGGVAWSGESVSEQTALNHSVVWACTRVLSESEAMLPLSLMQRRADGRHPLPNHPLYRVLHDEPNEQMSAMEFREIMTASCVLRGNAYARIVRRLGADEVIGLYPIHPSQVTPGRDSSGHLYYDVAEGGREPKRYTVRADEPHEIFHLRGLGFDGISGASVVSMARHSIGAALAAEKYAAKFYASGGRVPYVIEMAQRFRSDEDFKRWREDWNSFYGASTNWHQAVVMEPGMKYQQIGLSPEDSQFLETRQFGVPEICRWFLMRPHIIGDLSRATNNNIEHQSIEFVTMTLMSWLVRWEHAIARCLLTPVEKLKGLYAKHNVNALLRGDFKSRMEGYSSALQNGGMSIDEYRELEDLNPLPNGAGRAHHIQLNMQTVPGTGEPTAAELATFAKVSQERK